MTADEKHISRLAGDLKYDEKTHGSPAKHIMPHTHGKKLMTVTEGKIKKKEHQVTHGTIKKTDQ